MKINFASLTLEQFLSDYWQKKPIIIKGGISDFQNPIDPDELAGLASEPNIESRLMFKKDDQWKTESGPFESYEHLGENNWSLVVQSVNHWVTEAQDFARLFDFIPQWRFDDVMVSYATACGGVGPHVDNYDVFICQGTGQRRWKIGGLNNYEEHLAHEKLRHVKPFEAIIDEVVSEGDIVYIPPGYPHEGVSLDNSMSFSVGYKSVQSTELLSGFADFLIDFDKNPSLLSDKNRDLGGYGQINNKDTGLLRQLLTDTFDDKDKFNEFIGVYFSQSTSELDLVEDEYDYDTWLDSFKEQPLHKLQAVKTLYLSESIENGVFYVDGEQQKIQAPHKEIKILCDSSYLNYENIQDERLITWLWESTNRGYWYFDD